MATVSIEYYGMDGVGKNVTEAKRDAGRKVEAAIKGSYAPKLLASRGSAMLVWRDPSGWRSSFLAHKGKFNENLSYSSGRDMEDAYESGLMSLAQDTWDGAEMLPECLTESYGLMPRDAATNRRMLSDFAHWRGFQLAYKHAKTNGIGANDHEWHRWACDHSREFSEALGAGN